MPKTLYHVALILLVGGIALFSNLGSARLWDRDEPRNAGCAVEMLQRGDLVTPVFNDELRTHKPILLYWLIMGAYTLLGVNEFAARLPSAVLGLGTALLTYGLGRRLISPTVGLWSAVILLTTLMFDVASRAATPDSPLIFWTTAAIFLFVWGTFPQASSAVQRPLRWFPTWRVAVCMYACMGMAILAKGPVGLVLPTATIGLYLLIMRLPAASSAVSSATDMQRPRHHLVSTLVAFWRTFAPLHFLRTCWLMRPMTALAVALAVALPWYLLVGLRTDGEWLRGFFLDHNLNRATQSMEGHHGTIFYYPLALLAGFFPWSVFAVPTLLEIRHQMRSRTESNAAHILALCWVAVYVGAFTLARTKLPSYITPCYPAVAILVAVFLDAWANNRTAVNVRWIWAALIVLATIGAIATATVPVAASYFLPGEQWLAILGLVPIVTAAVAIYWWQKQRTQYAAVSFALGALLTTTFLFSIGAVRVSRQQQFDTLMAMAKNHSQSPRMGALKVMEPSWVFYTGRPVDRLFLADGSTPGGPVISRKATQKVSEHPTDAKDRGKNKVAFRSAKVAHLAERTISKHRGYSSRHPKPPQVLPHKPPREVWAFLAEDTNHFAITTQRFLEQLEEVPEDLQVLGRVRYFLKGGNLVLLARQPRVDDGPVHDHAPFRRTAATRDGPRR